MRTGFVLSSVHAFGYIPELQRMGPVIPACNFPAGVIYNLVRRGYEVYEHNPIDQKIKVRLTLENFNDTNKFAGQIHTEPVVQVEEKMVETPSNAEVIAAAAMTAEVPSVEEAVDEPAVTEEPETVVAEETPVANDATPQLSRKQRKALARQKAMEEKAAQETSAE